MSKAVLISIQPKWCEKIARGEKTIEVRKSRPKLETPFKCYIYCTYGKGLIERNDPCYPNMLLDQTVSRDKTWGNCCNGKVIGEFVCDSIFGLAPINRAPDNLEGLSCLTREEIVAYIKGTGYGWHISDLVIYDKPKELSEFCHTEEATCRRMSGKTWFKESDMDASLKKPPQSWCYVDEI